MISGGMDKISVILITQNEEKNIDACLRSVSDFADEIIVIDAFSEDKTEQIAREFTERVYQNKWPGFAAQKQLSLDKATCPWVLSIDADERVSDELKTEIRKLMKTGTEMDGFKIPRKSFFLGKWIRHCGWYPGYQVRLFRRTKTRVSQSHVHEGFLVDGRIGTLKSDIIHYSYPTLEDNFRKMMLYSSLEALDRLDRKQVKWYHFIGNPLAAFFNKYIAQKGFLDGIHGLIVSLITAALKLILYLRIWEKQNQSSA